LRTELLACPDCGGTLVSAEGGLECRGCGRRFTVEGGIPRLLPSESLGAEWERKQALGEPEYDAAPGSTEVARRFAEFAALDGLVLDVGCGNERRPAYLRPGPGRTYVGVDPLDGAIEREYDFVQGVGEHLPFAADTFDGAISATMLDHVPEPARVLAEIGRVLKPSGRLALWVGVVDESELRANALGDLALPGRRGVRELLARHGARGLATRAFRHLVANRVRAAVTALRLRFLRRRLVADVYADRARYHFWFFDPDDVLALLRQSGFRVLATERVAVTGQGTSLFVLAAPEGRR
jgi:SAM-dependent methyltransferase